MRVVVTILCALLAGIGGSAASAAEPSPIPGTCAALRQQLARIAATDDMARRTALLDGLLGALRARGQIPFVAGDSVVFLFRGEAASVAFPGDFNGWDPAAGAAERLAGTDLWLRDEVFPGDARLDYKIVRDGSSWLLDPANPRRQRGGFGDNSELRMPGSVPSPWVVRREGVPRGSLTAASLASTTLGHAVDYLVYTPAGYADLADLPVIYVTDGHEYADDAMGSMVIVLDNLIAAGKVRPLMAVFIDPRAGGRNRRAEQYVLNQSFVDFVAGELVPAVDAAYTTSGDRRDRGILGTSLGGLNSAWFALRAGDTFARIGIQSPAFQAGGGAIVGLFEAAPRLDVDIFMSWGTMGDFGEHTKRFLAVLEAKGYACTTVTVNEGHSWGNWRALLDDVLTAFWPAP